MDYAEGRASTTQDQGVVAFAALGIAWVRDSGSVPYSNNTLYKRVFRSLGIMATWLRAQSKESHIRFCFR